MDDFLIDLPTEKKSGKLPGRKLLERDIEKRVKNYAKNKHRMVVDKFTSPSKRSVPDDLFCNRHGFMFFIEFKAPGKKPTEAQHADHAERRINGAHVYVIDNVEQGIKLLDQLATVTVVYSPCPFNNI